MSTVIESLEKRDLKKRPKFGAGDRVRVHFQVVEGNRPPDTGLRGDRDQAPGQRRSRDLHCAQAVVRRRRGADLPAALAEDRGARYRRPAATSAGAKLYYLRDKVGKSARVAERRWGIKDDVLVAEEESEAVDAEGLAVSEAEAELVEPPEEEAEGEAAEGESSEGEGLEEQACRGAGRRGR